MRKERITPKNILAWIQGTVRYKLWYYCETTCYLSKKKEGEECYELKVDKDYPLRRLFIRDHIREQIEFRIDYMRSDCYLDGSCVKCGCVTTALQMANKSCKQPCYPKMMNKKQWDNFKKGISFEDASGKWTYFHEVNSNSGNIKPECVTLFDRKDGTTTFLHKSKKN